MMMTKILHLLKRKEVVVRKEKRNLTAMMTMPLMEENEKRRAPLKSYKRR